MKIDMSGAAAVIAAMDAIAAARLAATRSTPSPPAARTWCRAAPTSSATCSSRWTAPRSRSTTPTPRAASRSATRITYARHKVAAGRDVRLRDADRRVHGRARAPHRRRHVATTRRSSKRWLAAARARRRGHVAPAAAPAGCASSSRATSPTCATPASATAARSPPACSSSTFAQDTPWVHVDIAGPASTHARVRRRGRAAAPASPWPRSSSSSPARATTSRSGGRRRGLRTTTALHLFLRTHHWGRIAPQTVLVLAIASNHMSGVTYTSR